ncbi:ZP domain-containing protein [Caerostris extrusa]|uniref:ZP domain-containing protein n=1 Tax=Caerostris extrusa TaxID=172846 RepID=A0AAV4UMJ1_CAEEX|nr:ZP domain-containing protein [Caerostris extrusa]
MCIIPEETKTHIHHGHHAHSEVEPVPIGHYHKIIGHDAHWNSEEVKIQDEQYFRHHIPPVKGPSLGEPKPEPAAWSADEVRSLTKEEVIHPHSGSKSLDNHQHISLKNEHIRIPLSEQEVQKLIDNHHYVPIKDEHLKPPQVPQPEPAAWSADEVQILKKEQVFHPHISDHHVAHFKKELDRLVVSKEIFDEHKHHLLSQEPKPEPAPWTFDEMVIPVYKESVYPPSPVPVLYSKIYSCSVKYVYDRTNDDENDDDDAYTLTIHLSNSKMATKIIRQKSEN